MAADNTTQEKLILPPDGRQTRIDFFHSQKHSGSGQHVTYARKGSNEWWQTVTAWFKPDKKGDNHTFETFNTLLLEEGYSDKTRQSYLFMLRKFFEYYEHIDPTDITMGNIEDYNFEFFVSGRYSRSYQLQFINAIKLYYLNIFGVKLNLRNLRKTDLRRS